MALCKGTKKDGSRCANLASEGNNFCKRHMKQGRTQTLVATTAGAFIGNILLPGIGGLLIGASTVLFGKKILEDKKMGKTCVFISFDFDEDRALKEFIIQQARRDDSPFGVIDHSLKEAAPEKSWKDKARAAIKRSDIVLVMVGPKSHKAPGVLAEVQMAREEGIPIVQIIGYKDGAYTPVPNAGRLYSWNWENLKKLLG